MCCSKYAPVMSPSVSRSTLLPCLQCSDPENMGCLGRWLYTSCTFEIRKFVKSCCKWYSGVLQDRPDIEELGLFEPSMTSAAVPRRSTL